MMLSDRLTAPRIEARPYGPASSPEECAALQERLSLRESHVVVFRETPIQTTFSLDVIWTRLREMTAALPSYAMVIDLTEAERPSAEVRAHLRKLFASLTGLERVAVFTGSNFLLNVAAKFVLAGLVQKPVTVHRTLDEAMEVIRRGQR